jgi:hypothetical protein
MKSNSTHCQKNTHPIVVGKFDECIFEVPVTHLPGVKKQKKISPVKCAAPPVKKPSSPAGDYLIAILFDGKRFLFRDHQRRGQPLPDPAVPASNPPAK